MLLLSPQIQEADVVSQPQGHVQVLLNVLRGFSPQAAVTHLGSAYQQELQMQL